MSEPSWSVACVDEVDERTADLLWDMYCAGFGEFATVAAALHCIDRDEFDGLTDNPGVIKTMGYANSGEPVGLLLLARDPADIPWISTEFFTARYPEQAARGSLYYLAFTVTHPDYQRGGMLIELLRAAGDKAAERGAVVGFDMCAFNVDTIPIPDIAKATLGDRGYTFELVDRQEFWVAKHADSGVADVPTPYGPIQDG